MKLIKGLKDSIEQTNRRIDSHLSESLKTSGCRILKRGEVVKPLQEGEYNLIGLAGWDKAGMKSFEAFTDRAGEFNISRVFNLDDFPSMVGLENLIPGVKQVLQPPLVVSYKNGTLVRQLEGKAAREWLETNTSTGK